LKNRFTLAALRHFACQAFEARHFSKHHARLSAELLVRADARGVDSHGVARLSGYIRLIEAGRLNPEPVFAWKQTFPTLCTLDADKSIGFIAASAAMEKAIEMAATTGCGMVAVKNSNHFGIAGQYALMPTGHNMIGMAFTNASPLVAPTHSTERLLGTNPIAVAIPALVNKPFVLDMATTTAANGKLEILERKKQQTPVGWIQQKDGKDTTDPSGLKSGGALRPLGSFPHSGSHKGYGLGAVVDILSGVLSGANFGPWVPPFVAFLPMAEQLVGEGIGHFFMAFRVDGFMDANDFKGRMDLWMETFRNAQHQGEEPVLVPGDPEWALEAEREQNGVVLLAPVVEDLNTLAIKLGIAPLAAD